MSLQPILAAFPAASGPVAGGPTTGNVLDGFGRALVDAVQGLDRAQQEADDKSLQLAAGEPIELHDVMLAQDRASLNMQLALQVRNKLVESYQEIMRMQL